MLVKEHHYIPYLCEEWADLIFVMKRDIRYSISSRRKRNKALISKGKRLSGLHNYDPNTFEGFKKWCGYLIDDCFQSWVESAKQKKTNIHLVDYKELKTNSRLLIKTVYKQLQTQYGDCLKLDEDKIVDAIGNLHKYDKNITFFSPTMITNNGKSHDIEKHLDQQELDYIQNNFKDWIEE